VVAGGVRVVSARLGQVGRRTRHNRPAHHTAISFDDTAIVRVDVRLSKV
jgi:hypothetical protein